MIPKHPQAGFTLVELIVAATVFVILAANIAILFTSALGLQYRARGVVKVSENAQFALEMINREVRVSTISNANNCSSTLSIQHPVNLAVTYSWAQVSGRGVLLRNGQAITSPDVDFTRFSFCVSGSGTDNVQARVTMPMTIVSTAGKAGTAVSVSMQTTVAARDITQDYSD